MIFKTRGARITGLATTLALGAGTFQIGRSNEVRGVSGTATAVDQSPHTRSSVAPATAPSLGQMSKAGDYGTLARPIVDSTLNVAFCAGLPDGLAHQLGLMLINSEPRRALELARGTSESLVHKSVCVKYLRGYVRETHARDLDDHRAAVSDLGDMTLESLKDSMPWILNDSRTFSRLMLACGKALGETGKFSEALPAMSKAVELDPYYREARIVYGKALYDAGLLTQSVVELEAAAKLPGKPDPGTYKIMARAFSRLQSRGFAKSASLYGLALSPDDNELQAIYLGAAGLSQRDAEPIFSVLESAKEYNSSFEEWFERYSSKYGRILPPDVSVAMHTQREAIDLLSSNRLDAARAAFVRAGQQICDSLRMDIEADNYRPDDSGRQSREHLLSLAKRELKAGNSKEALIPLRLMMRDERVNLLALKEIRSALMNSEDIADSVLAKQASLNLVVAAPTDLSNYQAAIRAMQVSNPNISWNDLCSALSQNGNGAMAKSAVGLAAIGKLFDGASNRMGLRLLESATKDKEFLSMGADNCALVFSAMAKYTDSPEYYLEAATFRPASTIELKLASKIFIRRGQLKRAHEVLILAKQVNPEDAEVKGLLKGVERVK